MKKVIFGVFSIATLVGFSAERNGVNLYTKFDVAGTSYGRVATNAKYGEKGKVKVDETEYTANEFNSVSSKRGKNNFGGTLELTKNFGSNVEFGLGTSYINESGKSRVAEYVTYHIPAVEAKAAEGDNPAVEAKKAEDKRYTKAKDAAVEVKEKVNGKDELLGKRTTDQYKYVLNVPKYRSVPVYVTAKYNFTSDTEFKPYVKFDLGYAFNSAKEGKLSLITESVLDPASIIEAAATATNTKAAEYKKLKEAYDTAVTAEKTAENAKVANTDKTKDDGLAKKLEEATKAKKEAEDKYHANELYQKTQDENAVASKEETVKEYKVKNGLYYGLGLGFEYKNFLTELSYSKVNSKLVEQKSGEKSKYNRNLVKLSFGYAFKF